MSVKRGGANEVVYNVNGHTLQVVKELGEGGFATVYAVQDVYTKENYALKRVVTNDATQKALVDKEINIMQTLHHPNLIELVGYSCNPIARGHEYLIEMELCTGGTLLEHILRRGQRRWGEAEILGIFWQVCCAVEVLHSQSPPIAHRDLKTENIILGDRGRWKLIDFGSCTTRAKKYITPAEIHEEEQQIQKYSTPMYRAPEMADLYQKQLICEKVDIWALGCILYCMLFLVHPFQEGGSLVILNGCPPLPEHSYSQYPKQILKRLFALRVSKRPDITLVLEYLKKWKKFLEGGGDPDPDFSSHQKRSKSRKSGKKSSRRTKAEGKTPSDSRARSKTTAAPQAEQSGSDSASDSEDESHHRATKPPVSAAPAKGPAPKSKTDDLLDFQWVADWKPFDTASPKPLSPKPSSPKPPNPTPAAATSTSQGNKSAPDLLWFYDSPPQPVLQPRPPPPPAQMSQPFSASQAYQQALMTPQGQYGMMGPGAYAQPMYQQQPPYPQQFAYGQQPYGMARPPDVLNRRQTAPPPSSVPQSKPNPPSQAELDFDLAFR